MDTHASGFVDHEQFVVLIDDVERNVLSHDFVLVARTVHDHADDVARMDAVVRLHGPSVHADAFGVGGILDTVA